jgi:hypothetical protein
VQPFSNESALNAACCAALTNINQVAENKAATGAAGVHLLLGVVDRFCDQPGAVLGYACQALHNMLNDNLLNVRTFLDANGNATLEKIGLLPEARRLLQVVACQVLAYELERA